MAPSALRAHAKTLLMRDGMPTSAETSEPRALDAAELPGIDDKDIEVTVSDESITIKGEKKHEKDESGEGYQLSERSYGAFERTFGIPAGVDADKIAAEFSKGVLKLTLPKTPEAQKKQPKKIEVKAA